MNMAHLCRSALRSFKRRVAYANVNFDRILLHKIMVKHESHNELFPYVGSSPMLINGKDGMEQYHLMSYWFLSSFCSKMMSG